MGRSPSATFFYGYVFKEPDTWPWENEDYGQWESFRYRDWGFYEFYMHFVQGKSEQEVDDTTWEEKRKIGEVIPFTFEWWGPLEYEACYYLAPKNTETDIFQYSCSWEDPVSIPVEDLPLPTRDCDARLEAFAKSMRIDLRGQKPGWHMVASCG